jgi:hypothetical protein
LELGFTFDDTAPAGFSLNRGDSSMRRDAITMEKGASERLSDADISSLAGGDINGNKNCSGCIESDKFSERRWIMRAFCSVVCAGCEVRRLFSGGSERAAPEAAAAATDDDDAFACVP